MKLISATALSLMITGTKAMASVDGASGEGFGLLTTFLIAFGVLILVFQLLPGMALFAGIIKGIFSSEAGKAEKAVEKGRSNS